MRRLAIALLVLGCAEMGGDFDGGGGGSGGLGSNELSIYKSGGRIKMRVGRTEDGAVMFNGWYDTLRGEDCTFFAAEDGVTRCLPAWSMSIGSYYSDAGCSQALARHTDGCPLDPRYKYARATSDQCPTAISIYDLGALYTGSVYSGAACDVDTPPSDWAFYRLGAKIPPTEFAARTETIE